MSSASILSSGRFLSLYKKIIWYKNDVPLTNSRDFTSTFDGQRCILVKDRCDKENDSGTYRITAVNSVGQAESTCQVYIETLKSPLIRERSLWTRSPPVFIEKLTDRTVDEGQSLILRVRIDSQTKTQVYWLKEDQLIEASPEFQVCVNFEYSYDEK